MSGTSMDGVDGVLVDLAPQARCRVIAHRHAPYAEALRTQLLALNQPAHDELHLAALAANGVALAYAAVVQGLLTHTRITAAEVRGIGAHGQTVRHRPGEFDGVGYTIQLLNAALLAEHTAIDVICDFRSRDVAARGQGAPLVPAFHHAVFAVPGEDIAVLNLGGIANISFLPADGAVSGFDCGPGNVLLDLWCNQHLGQPMDREGAWAKGGRLLPQLLERMLQDSYIARPPPKSTGRDHFHHTWLTSVLTAESAIQGALGAQDVQHTLAHFTARAAADSILQRQPATSQLLVCGGGALNNFLMECLGSALPTLRVQSVSDISALDPMHVEATAFAWLAQAHLATHAGNLPAVTGACGPRILGARYPA